MIFFDTEFEELKQKALGVRKWKKQQKQKGLI